MKKVLYFAAIAAMFAACSSEELADQNVQKDANGTPLNFTVYTQRATRAGVPGNSADGYGVTTSTLKTGAHNVGFGVFGYYTSDGQYDTDNSTPNFMYNEQVTWNGKEAWTYEPVKYWPNEFGDAAKSDDIDYLTFFAYAPWTEVEVSTGVPPVVTDAVQDQQLNITGITKNTATGDPVIKYVVDTKPTTSVDLLWGVAGVDNGAALETTGGWTGNGTQYSSIANDPAELKAGNTFVNLTKEQVAKNGKVAWNFKHALARLNVQIITVVDQATEDGTGHVAPENIQNVEIGTNGDGSVDNATKVYLRSIGLTGFTMKGALNLHSEDVGTGGVAAAEPNWKDYDGVSDLTYDDAVTFYDGLKDGKEGTSNNIQKNEKPNGLNPVLLETSEATWAAKAAGIPTADFVNLFDGANTADDPIYVIPTGEPMNINVVYDVQTADKNLSGVLSDGVTTGSAVENKIYKDDIFGAPIEAGKAYVVKIYVGLTSVKFEAIVTDWDVTTPAEDVDLPKNGGDVSVVPAPGKTNQVIVGNTFKFNSAWDTDVTATIKSITGGIVIVTVSGCADPSKDGDYQLKIADFGTAIESDELKSDVNDIPVYAVGATDTDPALFTVDIKKN